ncbi:MAG: ABC-2 family transporter protein [Anaerolinea sp.]|nr:ABC-2 family transporter protein [Anaerolinea sp.]
MRIQFFADMPQLARIYQQQFKTWTAVQLQYRAAMIIWLIGIVIEPVVYLVVWTNVAQASGGEVNGFTVPDFAAYFIATMVVNHLAFTWHMWEYDYRIREGLLSPLLLRPLHPIHADVAENLSYKAITSLVMFPAAAVLILIFKPASSFTVIHTVAFAPSLILAFSIQFLWGWALAMIAFWTTRVNAIIRMYFLGKIFLAGQLAPVALLPDWLQTIATFSPYRWMLSFPAELLLARVSTADIWWGLLAQVIWTILGVAAVKLIWRAGVKRYAAFGA